MFDKSESRQNFEELVFGADLFELGAVAASHAPESDIPKEAEQANTSFFNNEYEKLLWEKASLEQKMKASLAEIDYKIQIAKAHQLDSLVKEIQEKVQLHGIKPEQVFPGLAFRKTRVFRIKYKNPATGETWNGRGRPPAWIEGKDRSLFLSDQ